MSGEPARKKFTITKASIEGAASVAPRRFVASFDATHLDNAAVAAALRALADQVEAPARIAAQADALRAKLAALDPIFTVTTRLDPPEHEGAYPIAANGQAVGSASFVTLRPVGQHRARPGFLFADEEPETPTDDDWQRWGEEDGARDEGEEPDLGALEDEERDVPPTYSEDDDVEFYKHDIWHPGIVIDQASEFTYIIEDKHGRRWEVNVHAMRHPEED